MDNSDPSVLAYMPHTDKLENMNDWTHIFRDYKGLWVAINGKDVVGSGKTPLEARKKAIEANYPKAGLFHVPKKEGSFVGATI